jgi:hypothetical protein
LAQEAADHGAMEVRALPSTPQPFPFSISHHPISLISQIYSGNDDKLDLTEEATKEVMVQIRWIRQHGPWYDNRFGGGLSTKLNGGLINLLCFLIIFRGWHAVSHAFVI